MPAALEVQDGFINEGSSKRETPPGPPHVRKLRIPSTEGRNQGIHELLDCRVELSLLFDKAHGVKCSMLL
jgi:hypothetical protein